MGNGGHPLMAPFNENLLREIKNMEEKMEEKTEEKTEDIGLFYKMLARRPMIDVIQDEEEQKHWAKTFKNSNSITLYSWRNEWVRNVKDNKEHFKYFHRDHSVKVFHNELLNKPIILVGAGPSLQKNIKYLKLAKEKGIKILANHHALMYLAREDVNIKPDYVIVLDSGKMWDEYYAFDKMDYSDVPLLADMTCNTEQLKKWKGPVYFFKSSYPDNEIAKFLKMEIERFVPAHEYPSQLEVGGHAGGAALGIAIGILQVNQVIFIGHDYCFAPDTGKFYPFDHKIDQVVVTENHDGTESEKPAPPPPQGQILDIFGNTVMTNNAYLGFKNVMDLGIRANKLDRLSKNQELDFINATEGGSLGSVMGGNSKWMYYMRFEDAIHYAHDKNLKLEEERKKQEDK